MKLKELIEQKYYPGKGFNCAEAILHGANEAYNLGLDEECMRLSAGFGGGMGVENVCGVLTGSIMVLSHLFVKELAHQSPEIKDINKELFKLYSERLGDFNCKPLKDKYRTEDKKCFGVVLRGAEILDYLIDKEKKKREEQ